MFLVVAEAKHFGNEQLCYYYMPWWKKFCTFTFPPLSASQTITWKMPIYNMEDAKLPGLFWLLKARKHPKGIKIQEFFLDEKAKCQLWIVMKKPIFG
jgi:hypothetical protein